MLTFTTCCFFSPLLLITQLFDLDTDFAAAPDVFPPDRFNAGMCPPPD